MAGPSLGVYPFFAPLTWDICTQISALMPSANGHLGDLQQKVKQLFLHIFLLFHLPSQDLPAVIGVTDA